VPTDTLLAIAPDAAFPNYERHRPEVTILYKTIAEHWKTFLATIDQDSSRKSLPQYVRQEFEDFLKCGVLAYGFLRVRCEDCDSEKIVAFSCKRRGFCPSCGGRKMAETAAFLVDQIFPKIPIRQWVFSFPFPIRYLMASNSTVQSAILAITLRAITGWLRKQAKAQGVAGPVETGAVTLIQRFGGSINLNLHFHMLILEGVYSGEEPIFLELPPPTDDEVKALVQTLSIRILRWLTRHGYFEAQGEGLQPSADLFSEQEPVLATCMAASIQYRIGLGPRAGQKVRRLGTMEECFYEEAKMTGSRCAALGGFSLHADTACEAWERDKLERLCRYVARPAIANERLFQRSDGLLVYKMKKPYNDGTEYLLFSPEELLEKLAALVPIPRVHLIRYHGCLAPHAKIREKVVPPREAPKASKPFRKRITWAQLLKRVFKIELDLCRRCGGKLKVIAAIVKPDVIERILKHLGLPSQPPLILQARAPPQQVWEF
jgi:hypothetical protein